MLSFSSIDFIKGRVTSIAALVIQKGKRTGWFQLSWTFNRGKHFHCTSCPLCLEMWALAWSCHLDQGLRALSGSRKFFIPYFAFSLNRLPPPPSPASNKWDILSSLPVRLEKIQTTVSMVHWQPLTNVYVRIQPQAQVAPKRLIARNGD